MVIGLSLMLVVRDIGGIQLNKYLYLVFVVGCMALANYHTLVSMVCFVLPLVCGLPATYIMPCVLILLVFKRGRLRLTSIFFVVCLSMLEILASFWYPNANTPDIVQYISFVAVMILLIHDSVELDYERCVRMYLYGVLLLCAVIVVVTLENAPSNWLDMFARGTFRFGEVEKEFEGALNLTLNTNSLAYYSITGIACGVFLAERRKGVARGVYIAIAVFAGTAGFFTVSRSWLLVTALCLLLYIISKLRNPKQFFVLTGVLLLIVAVGTILVQRNPRLLDGFVARFTSDDIETGNGRTDVFWNYMEYYFSDPRYILFGTGVCQYRQVLKTTLSMHNGTQQILVCTGVIGFAIYMCALIPPVLQVRKKGKRPFAAWLPLLGTVSFVQTIQFLNPTMLMLPYIICVFALRAGGQENENISHNRGHGGRRPVALDSRQ